MKLWARALLIVLVSGILIGVMGNVFGGNWKCRVSGGTEIFQGVTYGCERLAPSPEGSGVLHWVRVDLTAPGLELFVTPLDQGALVRGWQYRLERVAKVVEVEHLAVAINGTQFTRESSWFPGMSGDFARGVETTVADHVVSHEWEHTYLLWFDDQLTPHLRPSKPPSEEELARAKWAIGGRSVRLWRGKVRSACNRDVDSRTAVAIDPERKLLFLAVGNRISSRLILQKLADLGAKDGLHLDGGDSTSMAIGEGATGVSPSVFGGWRPVATHFGVSARLLPRVN